MSGNTDYQIPHDLLTSNERAAQLEARKRDLLTVLMSPEGRGLSAEYVLQSLGDFDKQIDAERAVFTRAAAQCGLVDTVPYQRNMYTNN